MTANSQILLDRHGTPVIVCARCGSPFTCDDFFELGLRLPEPDETRDEYIDDQLLEAVTHLTCVARQAV